MSAPDVLIAGAGIVGAACAYEFARAGLSVEVCDAGPVGSGATAAGMGHLVAMDDSEAQFALTSESRRRWHALAPSLPPAAEFSKCGTLWVAADEEEFAEVRRKHAYGAARSVASEILDSHSLHTAEPHLRQGLAGALLVPADSVVYAPAAAAFLLAESGATLTLGHSVTALSDGAATLSNGARRPAGLLVNALGCGALSVTPGLPIAPRKGHLVITQNYPGFVRHQLVELGYLKSAHSTTSDSVAFNIQPRPTGQLLIGSSRQFGAVSPAIDQPLLARMLRRAAEYIPTLGALSALRSWTGFRAATPDKLPLIGPDPRSAGLLLATGHEGLGVTTALATAALLAAHVTGSTPPIDPTPYLPARCLA